MGSAASAARYEGGAAGLAAPEQQPEAAVQEESALPSNSELDGAEQTPTQLGQVLFCELLSKVLEHVSAPQDKASLRLVCWSLCREVERLTTKVTLRAEDWPPGACEGLGMGALSADRMPGERCCW